jgi:hypothetical protein
MTNVSALRGTSACCAGDSARSRDEPESVRLEAVTLRAGLPFALAEHGQYHSRRKPQATSYTYPG